MLDSVDFTRLCVQAIRAALPRADVQSNEPLLVSIVLPSSELTIAVELANAYRDFKNAPQNLSLILRVLLSSLMGPLSSAESVATEDPQNARILPVVRTCFYFQAIRERIQGQGLPNSVLDLIVDPLNEFLSASYVFDLSEGMRSLTTEDLAELGLDRTSLKERALEELASHLEEENVEILRVSPEFGQHLYRVRADGVYESSILVLDEFWNTLDVPLRGDPVAFIPTRGTLIFTGSEDLKDLVTARELALNEYAAEPYPLDPAPYLRSRDTWIRMPVENLN